MENKICQCCGMPLAEEVMSKNKDGSLNEHYCKWCYSNGEFKYQTMDELIEACIPHMVKQGFSEQQARSYMQEMLPKLDYWRKK